jgi:predicted ArsR family transcriptional regulator
VTLGKVSDSKILELKERGMSLRQIASTLGMSHEAVRKRLKNLANKQAQISTQAREHELNPDVVWSPKI